MYTFFWATLYIEKISSVIKVSQEFTGTLYEDLCVFIVISRPIFLRIRNVSEARRSEVQNTHFVFSNPFLCFENCAI
jgi:hypothetical protein